MEQYLLSRDVQPRLFTEARAEAITRLVASDCPDSLLQALSTSNSECRHARGVQLQAHEG